MKYSFSDSYLKKSSRRVYESVDDKSLSKATSRKLKEKIIQVIKG